MFNPKSTVPHVLLFNEIIIELTFYNLIKAQIEHRLPMFSRNHVLSAEDILSIEFLCILGNDDALMAEYCLKHLARKRKSKLIFVSGRHDHKDVYILK